MWLSKENIKRWWRFFYNDFETFTHLTDIEALHYITDAGYKVETVLWTVLVAACIGLTLRNVSETVGKFCQRGTKTVIDVAYRKQVKLPSPTICVAFDDSTILPTVAELQLFNNITDSFLTYLANASHKFNEAAKWEPDRWEIVLGTRSVDTYYYQFLLRNQNLNQNQNTSEGYVNKVNQDPTLFTLTDMANYFLGGITFYENSATAYKNMLFANFSDFRFKSLDAVGLNYGGDLANDSIKIFRKLASETNRTTAELRRLVGSIICHQLSIVTGTFIYDRDSYRNGNVTFDSPCKLENQLWLGPSPLDDYFINYFCVKTSDDLFNFNSTSRKDVHLYLNTSSESVILDFSGEHIYNGFSRNAMRLETGSTRSEMTLTGEYENLYDPYNPQCDEKFGYADCTGNCIGNLLMKYCNCWPSSWIHLLPEAGIPVCSIWTFVNETTTEMCSNYFLSSSMGDEISECQDLCKPICSYSLLSFVNKFEKLGKFEVKDNTRFISFTVKNFLSQRTVESLEMDTKDFIAALGGSLSVFMGVSLIATVHAVSYVIGSIFRCIRAELLLKQIATRAMAQTTLTTVNAWRSNMPTTEEERNSSHQTV